MNLLKNWLIVLMLALAAAGCTTTSEWQAEDIPYPRTTPFDSNEFARTAYLDGFRSGYRSVASGGSRSIDLLTEPNVEARRLGYYAGAAQARAEREKE